MPYIETLDVLTINWNTTDTQTQNEHIYSKVKDEWQYTNKMQEAGKPEKCKSKHNQHAKLQKVQII